jgi:hypothetical protein
MYYTPVIRNFNIPELVEKYDCKTPPPEIAELGVLANEENKSERLAELMERAHKLHKSASLQPIFNITGEDIPQIIEQRLQVQEKEFVRSTLLDYWYKPLQLTCDHPAPNPKSICDKLQQMVTRYLKINAVIQARSKANPVKYTSKDGKKISYFNIKSDWYTPDGLKYQGLSVNYGRASEIRGEELVIKMEKLYTRMGYTVKKEEAVYSNKKVMRPDLLLEKNGKKWYIELKESKINKEYTEAFDRLIVNYELWTKYLTEYKPLSIDL